MTLAWSRHMYIRFVFDQKMPTFLSCVESAFRWFGGVPAYVCCDNLKSAVLKADLVDPVLGKPFRDLALHYGFKADPIRPRTPRHNGKAESSVGYVKGNLLAGQDFADLDAMNERGREWTLTTAGSRKHGTTKEPPLERFEKIERAALKPLPGTRFEIPKAHFAKVALDGRVTVDQRRYTVPPKYVGMTLEAYDNGRVVEICHDFVPVAVHPRAERPGEEKTKDEHLPEYKREVVEMTLERCREKAARIGRSCFAVVKRLLEDPAQHRLKAARCLLKLGSAHGAVRLEEACRRMLLVDDVNYCRAKVMLKSGADLLPFEEPCAPPASEPKPYRYARSAASFFGHAGA